MNVWYVNSILGTFRLEEEDNAICGLALCPDGVPVFLYRAKVYGKYFKTIKRNAIL